MWPQHTLQMLADHYGPRQNTPRETIMQGLLQVCNPIQIIFNHRSLDQLLKFYETISSEFLVQFKFQADSIFTRALVLTELKLTTSHSQSKGHIDRANLTTGQTS